MSQAPFPHKWRVIPPPVLIVLVALSLYDPSLKAMMVKHLSNQIRVPSPWKTCGPPERATRARGGERGRLSASQAGG